MKRLSVRNYEHNKQIPLSEGLLNGQSLGAVSGMKYGRSTVSYSGCECIAVYNALYLNGIVIPFPEVVRYMERYRVLFGFWGTNFLALGHCLRHFGLQVKGYRNRRRIAEAISKGTPALMVYWTKRRFASSVHTVCVTPDESDRLVVYNSSNHCGNPVTEALSAFLRRRIICAYIPVRIENKK